jgi:hypothetical protein
MIKSILTVARLNTQATHGFHLCIANKEKVNKLNKNEQVRFHQV